MPEKFPPVYNLAQRVARIPVRMMTKPYWSGQENLPAEGGYIVVVNHISEFDAVTFIHYMVANKVPVCTMAKAELANFAPLGWLMRKCNQILVYRESGRAGDALIAAQKILEDGGCVGLYPEGTITRDPDCWPMEGKTGAARLALRTRRPVIPMVQWGAQDVLDRYARRPRRPFPRKKVLVRALPAIDLSDLYERAEDPAAWKEATERIMQAITTGLEQVRGVEMTTPRLRREDKNTPTKKMVRWACEKWVLKNPKILPSHRPIGSLDAFLERAGAELGEDR